MKFEKDSVAYRADSIQIILERYRAIVDSFELVDETNETSEAVNVVKQEISCLTKVATYRQALADTFQLNNEPAIKAV